MYNLIKMDLYRLFRATSTKVMLIVIVAFSIFSVRMTKVDIDSMGSTPTMEVIGTTISEDSITMNYGFYFETMSEWTTGDIPFAQFMETQFSSAIFLVMLSIFVSIYVFAERENGFIKNIAGQLSHKWFLVASKLVGIAAMNFIMFAVISVVMFIAGKGFFGEQFILGSITELIKVLGGQYLLHMGFSSLIMALTILFNSSGLSVTVGVLLSAKVMTLLYAGLVKLAESLKIDNFDISKYAIEMNVTSFSINASQADIIRAMLVAITFIIISGALAAVAMQKRDIK